MNSSLANAFTKALPSVGRQFRFQDPSFSLMRPFSTTQTALSTPRDRSRSMESQILKMGSDQEDSPLSAVTQMMDQQKFRAAQNVSNDYTRMVESLEDDLIKQPYADRSPPHYLHVFTHRHNTILTLTRPNGNPIYVQSCGSLGFRKAGRGGFDAPYQLSAHFFGQMQEKGILSEIQRLAIVFRGFSSGREAFVKVLLGNEGKNVRGLVCRVSDATRIKFGGTRSKKARRLG